MVDSDVIEHDLLENKGTPRQANKYEHLRVHFVEAIDHADLKACIVKIAILKDLQTASTMIRNSLRQ
jgi:hypothetical protein